MPIIPDNGWPTGPDSYRVAHLADHHARGGAARAAYRIHQSLSASSRIESFFLGIRSDSTVAKDPLDQARSTPRVFKSEKMNRLSAHLRHLLSPSVRLLYDFVFSRNVPLENWLASQRADIVVVHWARPRDVPARSLRRVKIPVVAVLHDARFVLGISHYPSGNRGDKGATRLTSLERIAATIVRAALPRNRTTLICPSAWIGKIAILAGGGPSTHERSKPSLCTTGQQCNFCAQRSWRMAKAPSGFPGSARRSICLKAALHPMTCWDRYRPRLH